MKRRIYLCVLLCAMTAALTACVGQGSENETETETEDTSDYREEFTDEELAAGSASFQVDAYIYVDATLTPYEMYQDGVDSYYINYSSYENNYEEEETLLDTLNPFGLSLDDFDSILAEYLGAQIDRDSLDYQLNEDGTGVLMAAFSLTNGGYLAYWNSFFTDASAQNFYYPTVYYSRDESADLITADLDRLKNYDGDLDFATEEEAATQAIALIKALTGKDNTYSWTCTTYSEENLEALDELLKEFGDELIFKSIGYDTETGDEYFLEQTLDEIEYEEYYDFKISLEVNGLPVASMLTPTTTLYEGESAGDSITLNENNISEYGGTTTLQAIMISDMECQVGKDGILSIDVWNAVEVGDVYKEETVMTPSEILIRFLDYLSNKVIVDTLTIEDISLVYVSAFTDAENGVVEAALRPYWKVTTYDNWTFERESHYFNAGTGQMWG